MAMGADMLPLFSPRIVQYIETLLREGRIGICSGTLRIFEVFSGCPLVCGQSQPSGDRFKLIIPFAGHSITWEILFNSQYPEDPPDFIFGPDDQAFVPEIENIKSLVNWDASDPRCLLNSLQELLEQYKLYQQALIAGHSRLHFEYSSLIEGTLTKDDLEVHMLKKSETRIGPIRFLIKLPVDFKGIPAFLTKDNPGEDSAVLLVTFQSAEGSKVTPQLYLSPRLELALGGSASLKIPSFHSGGCLIDYVPILCELLKNKVDQVVHSYEKRKEYISAFLGQFGRSLVEYDSEGFTKISFIMEWHDFFFVFIVNLSLQFPRDQPTFLFQSVYHEANGSEPYTKADKAYPYSPRWSANEMVERARVYILDSITSFQRDSVKEGSIR